MKKIQIYRICDGDYVRWRDPVNAKIYESGDGPFFVVRVALDVWVPICTCGGKGGGLLDDGHSMFCETQFDQVEGLAVTVAMSGRHRTFPEDLFEVVKKD
jgi:hypothetical protein